MDDASLLLEQASFRCSSDPLAWVGCRRNQRLNWIRINPAFEQLLGIERLRSAEGCPYPGTTDHRFGVEEYPWRMVALTEGSPRFDDWLTSEGDHCADPSEAVGRTTVVRQSLFALETPSGDRRVVECVASPLHGYAKHDALADVGQGAGFDHGQDEKLWLIRLQDVTSTMRSEASLRESERRYRALVSDFPFWTFEELSDGHQLVLTPAAAKGLAIEQPLIDFKRFLMRFHPEDRERIQAMRNDHWRDFSAYRLEARVRAMAFPDQADDFVPQGDNPSYWSWVMWHSVPRRASEGGFGGYLTALVDVDSRKALEIDLVQLNASLEQRLLDRNSDLEAFTNSVSHDLRAPLRSIASYARLIRETDGPQLQPNSLQMLTRVQSNIDRMSSLLNDLLRFSHSSIGAVARMRSDMHELVSEVIAEQQDLGGPWARNASVVVKAMPHAHADPMLIRHVWESLISNAFKFTRQRPDPRIEIGFDDTAYFVRDNGVGFDPRLSDRLFRIYGRLHPDAEYQGHGVGLAIAQKVVERHGGRIWAESRPGSGASFYFTIPG